MIIDDEPLAQKVLSDYIELLPSLNLVGRANNGPMALTLSKTLQVDLLLLDINMPKMDGFELLSEWAKPTPLVVITSGNRDYALKGYEHAVVDFLYKPIFFNRFTAAMQRVEDQLSLLHLAQQMATATGKLTVRADRSDVNIPFDTINYIESSENYVKIYTLNQSALPIMPKMTVLECEQLLPSNQFIRISRKHIVNAKQIRQVSTSVVTLYTGEELPLGSKYRNNL